MPHISTSQQQQGLFASVIGRPRGAYFFFPSREANHVSLPCPNSTDGGRSIYMEDHPLLACSQLHDVQLPACAYSDMGFRPPSYVMRDGMEHRRRARRAPTLTRCGRWSNARNTTSIQAHRPCPFPIILPHIVFLTCLLNRSLLSLDSVFHGHLRGPEGHPGPWKLAGLYRSNFGG